MDIQKKSFRKRQYATIKNTGNIELNFANIAPESFMVQDVENPLKPGEEVTLWIIPRMGLTPWEYDDTLSYTTQEGAAVSVQAKVSVKEPEATPTPEATPSTGSNADTKTGI